MPIDKTKVQSVHDEVRSYFKGQRKSANKGYDADFKAPAPAPLRMLGAQPGDIGAHWKIVPGEQQRSVRNANAPQARKGVVELRNGHWLFGAAPDHLEPVGYGFKVLNQKRLSGNCYEMSSAAAYLVVLRRVGTPWMVSIRRPGDHALCVVTEGLRPGGAGRTVRDFLSDTSDAWVIDPWANVCCGIKEYEQQFIAQMQRWSAQGKQITLASAICLTKMDPAGFDYLKGFCTGPLNIQMGVGQVQSTLPRAVREHKNADFKSPKGEFGRWSADDDWS